MKGIIVNDLENAIKRLNKDAEEITSKVTDINKTFSSLSDNLSSKDLQFLTGRLSSEISLLKNAKNKATGYHNVLANVLMAYKAELEELAKNVSLHSSMHYSREEL